jgi:hypothetical protein
MSRWGSSGFPLEGWLKQTVIAKRLRDLIISVDVVSINGFSTVLEGDPNDVLGRAKFVYLCFSEDILINDGQTIGSDGDLPTGRSSGA